MVQKQTEWLDFIKVFAVFATLFLHSNATLVNFQTSIVSYPVKLNMHYWDIGVVFASLAGPSFALIFMYLGAVMLASPNISISFFWKKIKDLLLPLLFWTVAALLFQKYVMHWNFSFSEKLMLALVSPVAFNLWILYMLISMFLIAPVLKIFVNHSSARQQYYLLLLWFFAITIPPMVQKYYQIDIDKFSPMMAGYIGYMLTGYILSRTALNKKLLWTGVILFVVGNLWTIAGIIHYSPASDVIRGIYANYFFNRFSLPMLLNSIGSFILLRYAAEHLMRKPLFFWAIKTIAGIALGMCMVYPYWLTFLGTEKIGIELTAFSGNPLWSVPLTASMVIAGSFATVYMIKKIPYLYHIAPRLY